MNNTSVIEELKQTFQENRKIEQIQQQQPQPSCGGGVAPASPPSASSSPSHEFSFTISLHPPNSTKAPDIKTKQNPNPNLNPNTTQSQNQNPFAIDLTPADEIFFHGHLLPLHLLSHLPVSPRSSTNSIDTSLPTNKDLHSEQRKLQKPEKLDHDSDEDDDTNSYYDLNHSFHHVHTHHQSNSFNIPKDHHHHQKPKSKSFSLFGLPKRKKGEKEEKEKQRKMKFDVSEVIKRYMRMVRPFLSFRNRKNMQSHRQNFSYSGNLSFRGKNNNSMSSHKGIKRGAYSAPVSMKNSPTNSGLLVATPGGNYGNSSSSSSSDSTMEELQAAIQAAIAHCKKSSSSMEDKKIMNVSS
ncbi:BRI1 kinase inhibitor 1 [Capsicum chacoense]|uniref:BRI1 kinase inhibitor 1-like n=1 Tax=Capsicum annuum TaxID=4072 RepID=A0A1U8GBQ0_CAPAN|nr:putative protein phosphatase 2C 12-like isoform X1 [Capsicum annuum]KAF3683456.1 putative protein phosphatase 2C 12-like isoform X1 [Capsicum annuum]PHT84643.1 hypothetical protein T459_13086 [Capsicum annuum]